MELFNWAVAHQAELLLILGGIYSVALHIAALTPTKVDDGVLNRLANVAKAVLPFLKSKK